MMKKLFTLLLAAACFTASAQGDIDYPYNPDFENDGFVGIEDVLELLSVYGTPFTPEQLLLDGASLTEIIESLQSQIDSLASYTNEGFGAIALNDSLLTEYLVSVAAASEEGDSTLGAWVMQLSEELEDLSQTMQNLDSVPHVFESMALGQTLRIPFSEIVWEEVTGNNWESISVFSPENDGFCSIHGFCSGGSGVAIGIVPDTVETINRDILESEYSLSYIEYNQGQFCHTIPLNSNESLVLSVQEEQLSQICNAGLPTLSWTPLEASSTNLDEPGQDVQGPCQAEFTVNYHGYDYELVEIGNQCWFAENLRTTSYRNGEVIEEGNSVITGFSGSSWANLNQLTHVVQGDEGNYYSLGVVQSDLAICPAGWSVPSRNDWIELAAEVDLSLGGHFLKDSVVWNGSDSFGFGARPTGIASRQLITYDNDWFYSWSQCRDEWLGEQEWYNELQQHMEEAQVLWDNEYCYDGTVTPLCQGAMDALYNELDSLSSNGLASFESDILPFDDADDISFWVHVNLNAPFCPSHLEAVEEYYGEIPNSYTQQLGHRAYWWMSEAEFSGHHYDWGGVKGFIFLNDGTSILDFVQYGIGSDLGINENISIRCIKD